MSMAKATIVKRDPEPERGPDLFEDVKRIDLQLTSNEAKALLIVMGKVGGHPETTLRGEIDTVLGAICQALGAYGSLDWKKTKRYLDRNDLARGNVFFFKGGAHV